MQNNQDQDIPEDLPEDLPDEEPQQEQPGEPQHSQQELQVANYSRRRGFHYLRRGNPGRAFAHLIVALQLMPEWRAELRTHFLRSLNDGCKKLEVDGKLLTVIELKKQALDIYPESEEILCDIATHHLQLGHVDLASDYYKQSLHARPNFLPAVRGMETVKNVLVERWHFRMLNDKGRNRAYYQAISTRVQQGYDCVLDIGTGTGILSIYAVASGATKVWACESQKHMWERARAILEANGLSESVELLNEMSTNLSVPRHIPRRVSLVITETFDAGVFGEGVLHTLVHAWESLLLSGCEDSEGETCGVVIPYSVTLWIAAIQCIDIARRHRLLPTHCVCDDITRDASFVRLSEGRSYDWRTKCFETDSEENIGEKLQINFGEEKLCRFCEAPVQSCQFTDSVRYFNSSVDVAVDLNEAPYDTEDLQTIPNGYQLLTKPYKALEVNFNKYDDVKSCIEDEGKDHLIPACGAGSVDAIAAWFHLNLDNNGTILSTAPFKEECVEQAWCWHQAVFPFSRPQIILPGETVALRVSTAGGELKISSLDNPREVDMTVERRVKLPKKPRNADEKDEDDDEEEEEDSSLSSTESMNAPPRKLMLVSDHVVAFLNNRTWMNGLLETATQLYGHFKANCPKTKRILDTNPFPILGLKMLSDHIEDRSWELVAFAASKADEEYIRHVANESDIHESQLRFVSEEEWSEASEGDPFVVINVSVNRFIGELNEKVIYLMPSLRSRLVKGGIMVPHTLIVECQIIESDWLLQNSYVTDNDNVGSVDIAQFINEYMVNLHLDVCAAAIQYKALTGQQEVAKLRVNHTGAGSLCSEQSREFLVTATGTGKASGVLYWVKLILKPGVVPVSTLCHDSHCNQAAILTNAEIIKDQKVKLECVYHHGLINISTKGVD